MRTRTKVALVMGACALAWIALLATPRQARLAKVASSGAAEPSFDSAPKQVARAAMSSTALVNTAPVDRHPHPITEEHRRLFRDADLIDGAAAALRKNDLARARALLAQHTTEYGQDTDNEGLVLLADCIEHKTPQAIERARAFYDRHTHSMMRRQIRKQCLELTP